MRAFYLVASVCFSILAASAGAETNLTVPEAIEKTDGLGLTKKKAKAIAFVEKQMKEYRIPGVMFSVVYKNQTVIAQGLGTTQYGRNNTPVTEHTIFQVGPFTKTFLALGIAKLIDEGRMAWNDPVKQHLPWFQLQDKYAEKYTSLSDLLSMNSVFGDHDGDIAWSVGVWNSERDLVKHLDDFNTSDRALRPGYAYSNLNFEILGQVIEQTTNGSWFNYIKRLILDPIGMNETFGKPADVPQKSSLSYGHLACAKTTSRPFSLLNDSEVALTPSNGYFAAGSIVSSAHDMAIFSKFLLNYGAGVFKNTQLVRDMVTGHTIFPLSPVAAAVFGVQFNPEGSSLGSGYGIDFAGQILFGKDFFMKNGKTNGFELGNGFIPSQNLGVTLGRNVRPIDTEPTPNSDILEPIRSYVMGIFLDIPMNQLDAMWKAHVSLYPGKDDQECDAHLFKGKPWETPGVVIPKDTQTKLVGSYVATKSPGYFGTPKAFLQNNSLTLQWGAYIGPLIATPDPTYLIWGASGFTVYISIDVNSTHSTIEYSGLKFTRVD
ncbi:hypothetical protein LEN26_003782 [Aphanomyces euteiches]|nr:hypothetical protein LEN26_003782 [Aphanomyces euteiches]KAH9195991.1 hypothetical protein AeNC1_002031 [Aphanomyces euteiches]